MKNNTKNHLIISEFIAKEVKLTKYVFQGGEQMKTVVAYIQNRLLSSGLKHAIVFSDPTSTVSLVHTADSSAETCWGMKPDVFVAEVRDAPPLSIEDWFVRAEQIKKDVPDCKIVFIADEENWPKSAAKAKEAFRDKKIDMFFYSSSGLEYLADTINNL